MPARIREDRHLDEQDYRRLIPGLRDDLLAVQSEARKAQKFSVALIVTGIPAAGRSETVNRLLGWLDPKYVTVRAFGATDADESELPPMWRYWRALPAYGRIAVYFSAWYGDCMACMLHDSPKAKRRARRMLARIRQLEAMLVADGVRIVKIHLTIDADTQRRRLAKLRADKLTRWRVTKEDMWLARHYKPVHRAVERCLTASDHPAARWHLIDGTDEDYREIRAGEILREAMQAGMQQTQPRAPLRTGPTSKLALPRVRESKVPDKAYERELEQLQGRLAALTRRSHFHRRGLVLAFEGMDAAGKGGAIARITHALDARQYQVVAVSAPTSEERSYPYLWRFWRAVPLRGQIAIFDRSWYGRVLVERVRGFTPAPQWRRAYDEIGEFERQLVEHGLIVAKFWLHVSKTEQLQRFKARDEDPLKRFKVDPEDWVNRRFYGAYQGAAAEMIQRTDARDARWTIVSADDKKSARLQVLRTVCETIEAQMK